MILKRLYELALREGMLADSAVKEEPVKFVIKLGDGGKYLGIQELFGRDKSEPSKKGKAINRGKDLPVPCSIGSPNAQGAARFFADALARVVPLTFDPDDPKGKAEDEKRGRSRATFWTQMGEAAEATDDPALRAVQAFGRQLASDPELVTRVNADCEKEKASPADRCTFVWNGDPDRGATILEREPVRAWFRGKFREWTGAKQEAGPVGVCQITGEVGPIPTTHPLKIPGVPGGLPTGVSLISFDKDAFQSYGLDGAANAGIGYEAAEGYSRALIALIQEKLAGSPRSRLRVSNGLFLFWSRDRDRTVSGIVQALEDGDPRWLDEDAADERARESEGVPKVIESPHKGRPGGKGADPNRFYGLALSGNAARAIVRGYLELELPKAKASLARWFEDLRIATIEKGGAVSPSGKFPLWMLTSAVAAKAEDVPDDVYPRLLAVALEGGAPPESILAACLHRLRAEGSDGFRPARLALIKLFLKRRDHPVSESLDTKADSPAYACGRLLCVFEDVQRAALGDVNASIVDKYYGAFSAAPLTVIGRLFVSNMHHLRKLRDSNPKACKSLDRRVTEVSSSLKVEDLPRGQLSLVEQAYFALGYYHQKAKKFEEIAAHKARKAEDAAARSAK